MARKASRQLNYMILPEEEEGFFPAITGMQQLAILPQTTLVAKQYSSFSAFDVARSEGTVIGPCVHLWNPQLSPEPRFQYFPRRAWFCLDFLNSEVINVDRCTIKDGILGLGRLHVTFEKLEPNGSLVSKGKPFIDWCDSVFSTVRKTLKCRIASTRVSQRAFQKCESGLLKPGDYAFW